MTACAEVGHEHPATHRVTVRDILTGQMLHADVCQSNAEHPVAERVAAAWRDTPDDDEVGCSCTPDPDNGDLHDDDGWPCQHG